MARPLRIEFGGAIYHVMSRGNNRAVVFLDDGDRRTFLRQLDRVGDRLGWRVFAYCLMNNHYHLVFETPEPSLARGMRDLNGTYAQHFNRMHDHIGHVFQARYRALLVERGSYLLEVIRYVVLNPVRAGLCERPDDWGWSSHRTVLGRASALASLESRRVLSLFGGSRVSARSAYADFVLAGIGVPRPVVDLPTRMRPPVSGSPSFRTEVIERGDIASSEVPRRQRATRDLAQYQVSAPNRNEAIRSAYASGQHSLVAIGRHFRLHYSTISKICRIEESEHPL